MSGKAIRTAWSLQREDREEPTTEDRERRARDIKMEARARREAKVAAKASGIKFDERAFRERLVEQWELTVERRRQIKLPPATHHVLLCLAEHFKDQEHVAWPGQARISASTGISVRNVQRALDELEMQGLVIVKPRLERGRKVGVLYELPFYDPHWVGERIEADFDHNGHYDADLAAENKLFMASITHPPEPDWDWLDAATVGPGL